MSKPTELSVADPLACFGIYDIRAIVNESFNENTYDIVGRAFSTWLKQQPQMRDKAIWVAVGYDARIHSKKLTETLIESLRSQGIGVVRLGFSPTPAVYFAQYASQEHMSMPAISATLTVTASHNPAPYNGLKFTFQPELFVEQDLLEVKALYAELIKEAARIPEAPAQQGPVKDWDILPEYRDYLVSQFNPVQKRWKVVVDSGNATAGVVAPEVFRRLGCDVIDLFTEPNGEFPNHHPDPCQHKNLQDLIKTIQAEKADFGVAFDGDSDRLGVVDAKGRILSGDILVLLFAEAILGRLAKENKLNGERPVMISEVKCTQVVFDTIEALGGEPVMSKTGHLYIKRLMKERHGLLGGELSGHFFFQDRYLGFDDAFYAALRFLELLDERASQESGLTSDQLTAHLPKSILSEEKRVPCPKSQMQDAMARFKELMPEAMEQAGIQIKEAITIDGLRLVIEGGFVLVRASNTEPCLTVRYESPDNKVADSIESLLSAVLSKCIQPEVAKS